MKKIVILLIVISSLFGRWKHQTDPTILRQIYVLDENYIKHYPRDKRKSKSLTDQTAVCLINTSILFINYGRCKG